MNTMPCERTLDVTTTRTRRFKRPAHGRDNRLAPRAARALGALLFVCIALIACGGRGKPGVPVERIALQVNNRGYYDVTVYAVRSSGSSGARLGNVPGGSNGSLWVRLSDLQAGSRLVVRVRAIGTSRNWTSPAVSVGLGAVGRLNVYSTNSGDLSQSTLFVDY